MKTISNPEPSSNGTMAMIRCTTTFDVCAFGIAPNNSTPWYKNSCVTGALKTGAINAGVDTIGFIPEAGGVARMIGHGAGYRGVVADQLGGNGGQWGDMIHISCYIRAWSEPLK